MFVQNFKICCFMCLLLLVDANKVIKTPYGEGSAQINTVKYQKLKFSFYFDLDLIAGSIVYRVHFHY